MSHTPDSAYPQQFTGTQRFAVLDQLGAGSMCVVYKVQDRKHGDIVALKTLRHLDSNSLYRLKQEFRALSHFDHPNLVSFSELVYSDQGWFVTMELVEGTDFLTFCRGDRDDDHHPAESSTWSTDPGSLVPGFSFDEDSLTTEKTHARRQLPDMIRLRSCMRQLAEGVQTLHAAGRVHRDLKPSNVLVTDAGRVVILDFGLVAEIDQDYTEGTLHQNIAGSAAYMSPEQSVGKPLAESSDWYSVGVMLYEALTGVWPYTGHLYQILTLKQEEDPPPPSSLVDGVPPELEELCMALLQRDPEKRPSGPDVLRVFRSSRPTVVRKTAVRPSFRFRNPQLHEMMQAFQAVKQEQAVTLLLRGPQGSGKTTLAREFVKSVKRRDEVVILKARCFQWESVPYKAIDGLMDNLSRVLRRLDHRDVSKLGNAGLPYLGHLFPVLDRVDAFGLTEPADLRRLDVGMIRQRAFEGLFQLLRGMASRSPLLLFFDDVQWGDPDSAAVLAEIVRFSADLPILVVLAYRTDGPVPFIARFVGPVQEAGVDVRALDLEAMTLEQACVIASEMLQTRQDDPRVVQIARESGGIPSYIQELVRQLEFQDTRAAVAEDEEINEVTVSAIGALPDNARRLLYVLALCEHPLPDDIGLYAADLKEDAFQAVSTLRAHNLVNVTGARGGDTLEIGSERVRDFVLDRIPEDLRTTFHSRVAQSMEARGGIPPDQLVAHYVGAHQDEKAGLVAWLSADEALKRGRVHEAIWLLRQAREHGSWTNRERRTILSRLADALSRVGAGKEAAAIYQEAAGEAAESRSRELLHRAAEELIGCGEVEQGTTLLDQLLVEAGVRMTSGKGWFGGGLQRMRKMRLRWRGMDFTSKAETTVSVEDLHKVDLCWTRAMSMGLIDASKAAASQVTHLELALEVGEPERALRALASEVRFQALAREPEWRERYEHVLHQAKARQSRQALARATSAAALGSCLDGNWREAAQLALSAEQMLAHNQVGAAWERFHCRLVAGRALVSHGDLSGAAEVVQPLVQELERVDNPLFLAL
ncbi:MAG: protein kinase, partial [Myxococcales bacterium]|nr:protein kinase [Myxococcales bacterium]